MTMHDPYDDEIPFRRFSLDGWNIYLGRNDAQNDELTTQFARPKDIWMHAANHPGSHLILRRDAHSDPPPHTIILKAASIAAWFSKARNAPFAKVHVAEACHVRKMKNAPRGEVTVQKYKTVRVVPACPTGNF